MCNLLHYLIISAFPPNQTVKQIYIVHIVALYINQTNELAVDVSFNLNTNREKNIITTTNGETPLYLNI